MFARIRRFLTAPVFEGDEESTSTAAVLNTLLMISLAGAILFPLSQWVFGAVMDSPVDVIVIALIAIILAMLVLLRLGYVRFVGIALSFALWAAFTLPMFIFGGLHDSAITGYFIVILISGIAAGGRGLFFFSVLSILAIGGAYYAENNGLITPEIPIPSEASDLILVVMMLGIAAVLLRYAVHRLAGAYERARQNAEAVDESNRELQASRNVLEARTRELEKRARYLEATALIAREAASMLDPRELLSEVANLVSERFGFYHTGIFLTDPEGEWAVLEAASSEGGKRMLARAHRLRVGLGIVGYVAAQGEPRIALDVGEDAVFFDNPDLPDTRSEMALPLQARGTIIGILDVQSTEPGAFSEEDVAVLQTLADQVALAISNARLFQQAQESLQAERRAYGELSGAAWRQLLMARTDLSLLRDEHGFSSAGDVWLPEMEQALKTGQAISSDDGAGNMAVPIKVRGQIIGTIDAQRPDSAGNWTPEQTALLEQLADQLGDALEDARLFQEAQTHAAREQMIGQVASHMRESLDIDTVLQTAVEQMRDALELAEVEIRMGTPAVFGQADTSTDRREQVEPSKRS